MKTLNLEVKEKRLMQRKTFDSPIYVEKAGSNTKIVAKGVDISKGGLGIVTDSELKIGQIVKIYFPIAEDLLIPVFAEVLWSNSTGTGFRIGLCFVH